MAGSPPSLSVEIDEWPEPVRLAAYDCDNQGESKHTGHGRMIVESHQRLPIWAKAAVRARVDSLSIQGRPIFAGPMDVLIVTDLQQQIDLLFEKRVVVLQSKAEQGKRLDG